MLRDTSTLLRRVLKLKPKQQLLSSILFTKHDNVIVFNMLQYVQVELGEIDI
jgi:hypothetical protein